MADISNIAASASNAASSAFMIFYYGFFIIIFLAIILFLIYRMSFNCKVRLKYLTNSQDQFSDKKGKVIRDKRDGIEKLIVSMGFFKKITMPAPPPEATSLDLKGRRCFEVEIGDDGSKRYIVRKKAENTYLPLDSNDRVFYLNEEEKRLQRNKKGISELIAAALPYIALVIILALLLTFWGDVVKPLQEENARWQTYTLALTQKQAEITGMLKEIIKREQVVPSEPAPVRPVEELPAYEPPPVGD